MNGGRAEAVAMGGDIRRRHFVAIATGEYEDPAFEPLAVTAEVKALREWLCAEDRGIPPFVPAYPELANNPTRGAVRDALENPPPQRRWRDADAAVVFVTGHGVTQDGVHWTVLQDSESDRLPATALRTADLILWLKDTRIRYLFLILDQCFAGATVREIADFEKDLPATWLVLPSATRDQEAVVGALTGAVTAFLAELRSPEGAQYGGPRVDLLDVAVFLERVQAKLGPGQRLVPLQGSQTSGKHPCLPNPHYRALPTVDVQVQRSDLALPKEDLEGHWEPRSRGVARVEDTGWLFTGRDRLLRELVAVGAGEPGATLVTGGAGSGKSAALAWLVTFSDPVFRARHHDKLAAVPLDLRPVEGAVDVAVLATGKTALDIVAQLATALGVPTPVPSGAAPSVAEWIDAWQQWLAGRTTPVTVVVDALDEADGPATVLTAVLSRLDPGRDRVRLLVGVRSPGGDGTSPDGRPVRGIPLADQAERALSARRIRVDEAPWWDQDDLVAYAARVLTGTEGSPYLSAGPEATESVARALAARARTSFLITRIAAANLARRARVVDPGDASWLTAIDDGVLGVFRADLHAHRPDPEDRLKAIHLLRAVAFARGRGIPWRRIWPAFANAVADEPDRSYGDTDIADLLASPLGGYLTADTADGTTVYRLFHDALGVPLRDRWRDLMAVPPPA
ncbi:ATP-binding protein [Streptomyces sp. S.PNR 29]|uniref:ATP-binding protein n=1 Tax=Streptomyces sp. S.PNR 29 TaxID=2973805 RepID=UPI0025AF0EB3|nr:ATP-binding protein [Streptomyces sp. S.PNR 29]MDN0193656.1 ATP-binding protein [Streptomyces sp. S.PNR 29]